jgi:flagellar biosynthetic protein FliQ
MTPSEAVDLIRNAAFMAMIVGGPLLVVGMVVGLLISLLQALTQVQDQTVSAVPKIVAMVLAMVFCLPWITDRMIEYSHNLIEDIPEIISE